MGAMMSMMRPVMFSSPLMSRSRLHLLLGEQRREVLEHHLVLVLLGRVAVDLVQLGQGKVALAILGDAHFALNPCRRCAG